MNDFEMYPISTWVLTVVPLTFAFFVTAVVIIASTISTQNKAERKQA